MTTPTSAPSQSMTVRLIHGALATGVVLFGLVTHFVLRPNRVPAALPPMMLNALLGVALVAALVGCFILRGRVPRRSTTDSPDLFWSTALPRALVMWSVLEGGALAAIVAYLLTGAAWALVAAAINLACMSALHPGRLERA